MSSCPVFSAEGPANISEALSNIDCQSGQAVEIAFSRLFGENGALGQALTLILTLYVALLALGLLTGRTRLSLNMLAPRMLQLGLVLTFATSWVAYQTVAWNLLVGAPDEVAGIILGTHESATALFASRLDALFHVIANSAHSAAVSGIPAATNVAAPAGPTLQIASASPHPSDLLWLASLLLLLGTVGVLIVARIALAAVMALGPIFIVMLLFKGTRGLFEGWLKAALMLALTPMFAVLLGGGTLVLIAPMIDGLEHAGGTVTLELATAIFLASFVYLALLILGVRAAAMIVNGWRIYGNGLVAASNTELAQVSSLAQAPIPMLQPVGTLAASAGSDRLRGIVSGMSASTEPPAVASETATASDRRTIVLNASQTQTATLADVAIDRDPRIRPLGQGFVSPNRLSAKSA